VKARTIWGKAGQLRRNLYGRDLFCLSEKQNFMKHAITVIVVFFIVTAFEFVSPKHKLVGRWIIYPPDNRPEFRDLHEYVDFKNDGTYDVVLPNGKIGEVGNYKLNGSVFLIKNMKTVCGDGYWGSYKLTFHGRDSVSFVLIEDSCTARRQDIVGGNPGLKRFKAR
jgi:hypothetical protein